MNSMTPLSRRSSQWAGAMYLIIAVVGGFSIGTVPEKIVQMDDAATTFQNLMDHSLLFRFGMAGDIVVLIMEVVLTVLLFQLFKSYGKTAMTVATYSRFAMAIIMGCNLINYLIPAILVEQPEYLQAFSKEQLEGLVLVFLKAHKYGELIWQIFFAIHLPALGYTLLKSQVVHKWLGRLMVIGGMGYGGDSLIQLLGISFEPLSMVFVGLLVAAVIGEFWFAFWLLLKGGKAKNLS
ncbi:DUF4386 domain-containing protein [bacterium SCSIO 12741]|nr:DUF4386 domain-containing protein [bacterium SCSIO 12741]